MTARRVTRGMSTSPAPSAPRTLALSPWKVILPHATIELEVVVTPSGVYFDAVAHCPGVGHTPGAHTSTHSEKDLAAAYAVGKVMLHFWQDGIPAVVVPPGAYLPLAYTPHPVDNASASAAR